MRKILLPSVVVLIVAAIALSLGVFSGDSNIILVGDEAKSCGQTAVMASSSKECGDKGTQVAMRDKQCGDKARTTLASDKKECGSAGTAVKAADKLECPHSGAVLRAADEKESCGDKTATIHASTEKTDKEEVCCEAHALALAD